MSSLFSRLIEAFHQPGVFWIYWIILACLATQIFILLRLLGVPRSDRQSYCAKVSNISEWAINVPPTFGVLGTIIAMAQAIGMKSTISSPQDFLEPFMLYFWAAVSTTILGGIVYGINLGLNAAMSLWVSSKTECQ